MVARTFPSLNLGRPTGDHGARRPHHEAAEESTTAAKPCSTSSSATASVIYGARARHAYPPQQRDVRPQRRVQVAQQLRLSLRSGTHPVRRAVHALLRLLTPTRHCRAALPLAVQRYEVRRRVRRLPAALRPHRNELATAYDVLLSPRRQLRLELVGHHHGVAPRCGVHALHLERDYA